MAITIFFFKDSGFLGRGELWLLVIGAHRDSNPEGAGTLLQKLLTLPQYLESFIIKCTKQRSWSFVSMVAIQHAYKQYLLACWRRQRR